MGNGLPPMIKEVLPTLQKHNEITIDATTTEKLLAISSATIDKLLKNREEKVSTQRQIAYETRDIAEASDHIRIF